jgi:hypothetical protein
MNLERELRHKSEDIADGMLLDTVRAIGRRVRVVNGDYDVPYIAGYTAIPCSSFGTCGGRSGGFSKQSASNLSYSRTRLSRERC